LAALVAATAVAAVGNHLALTLGYSLVGVAISTSLSYTASYLLMVAISIWPELDRAARERYSIVTMCTLLPSVASAILLEAGWPSVDSGPVATTLKIGLVFVIWSATVVVGWHWGGWKSACRAEGGA
jgi:hypothetical protein